MKNTLVLAAALALAACATAGTSATNGASTAKASTGTYFCWKDRLATQGDALVCNWSSDMSDACRFVGDNSPLPKASIASGPVDDRRCANGQWLVKVTTR